MIVFLIKRLANAALVMLVAALMAFMIFRFVGDPVQLVVNEQTSQAESNELRERLGLNQSMPMQYLHFVINAVLGDFGISYRNQQEVMSLIAERFPATIELVLMATILSRGMAGLNDAIASTAAQNGRFNGLINGMPPPIGSRPAPLRC